MAVSRSTSEQANPAAAIYSRLYVGVPQPFVDVRGGGGSGGGGGGGSVGGGAFACSAAAAGFAAGDAAVAMVCGALDATAVDGGPSPCCCSDCTLTTGRAPALASEAAGGGAGLVRNCFIEG